MYTSLSSFHSVACYVYTESRYFSPNVLVAVGLKTNVSKGVLNENDTHSRNAVSINCTDGYTCYDYMYSHLGNTSRQTRFRYV